MIKKNDYLILFMTVTHVIFTLTLLMSSCIAQTQSSTFNHANECYKVGDYAQAYALYKQIPTKDPAVLYNMGSCAYKLEKFGYALAHWRQAECHWRLWGRNELLANIALVKKQTIQTQQKPGNQSFLQAFFDALKTVKTFFISIIISTPLFYLQCLVLFVWIFLFVYIRYLFRAKKKLIIATLFGLLCLVASMLALKYSILRTNFAVIVHKNSPLFSGPGKNFALLGHLPEAQEVVILKESEEYYKIRVSNYTGWVEKNVIEKI